MCIMLEYTKGMKSSFNFAKHLSINYFKTLYLLYIPNIVWYLPNVCNPLNTSGI